MKMEPWNCSKTTLEETSERRGGAHMGFSERIDTILIRIELRMVLDACKISPRGKVGGSRRKGGVAGQ